MTLNTITQPPFTADTLAELVAVAATMPDGSIGYAQDTQMLYKLVSGTWNAVHFDNGNKTYVNGTVQTTTDAFYKGRTTSTTPGGQLIFNMTVGGGSTDPNIFANPQLEDMMLWINNKAQSISNQFASVSASKKQLTIDLIKLTNIIGILSYTTPGTGIDGIVWVISAKA